MSFEDNLAIGKTAETDIARWLMSRGNKILPVYEKEEKKYQGPVFHASELRKLVAPDLLVFGSQEIFWAEVKRKSAFSWHRISERWTTGIDLHHYNDYLGISKETSLPIWLFFYHCHGIAKDTPVGMTSPTWLFGGPLERLGDCENHRSENWGRNGMVYWGIDSLKKFSDYPLDLA